MSILDTLLGRPLASEEDHEQRVGVAAGVPTFGLDALGSAAYGPEAALTILIPAGAAALAYVMPLSLTIIALLAIVYFSYRQTIDAYPRGGGSYTVASENLGRGLGLLAAAALMLDYLLDVGVGISTGVGALVSAVPKLGPHTLGICILILVILTVVNLRGVRESGILFMAPTYIFVACLLGVLGWGTTKALLGGGHPQPVVSPPHPSPHAIAAVSAWLLIRAFASGCTALTGVEAVSNGVMAFKDPNTKTARRTLTVIVVLLALFLAGIAHLTRVYGITATEPSSPGYQSLLSMITAAVAGKGSLYYITIASILVVLSLSANTAFADFPRLCRAIAEDGYLPRFFAIRGRRLVYTEGIFVLAILSGGILVIFGGVTDRLIPLFAIGAFLAFTLSQAGMVMHWRRTGGRRSKLYIVVNCAGAIATGCTVAIVLVAKFVDGAWITVLMIPLLIFLMRSVHQHYQRIAAESRVRRLHLVKEPPPVAIVPVSRWDRASEAALQFACSLTPEVQVLHIECPEEHGEQSSDGWQRQLEEATLGSEISPPTIVTLASPFRFITMPILEYVRNVEGKYPDRKVAVIVPELVSAHWYHYLLHNHRSTALKALLLVKGNHRIVVINVPWYLNS
ncbi:MAG: Amino acid transporter [Edaphobacter sp.]|nr:Amino acid transporter [Edaphobacter sp.]